VKKIILVGGGGHCKVVIDALLQQDKYDIVGIIDLQERVGNKISGIPIIGADSELENYYKKGIRFSLITTGSIGNPNLRIKLFNLAKKIGFEFPNVVHPNATVSKSAEIGKGNYIAPGVIINSGSIVGNNCIINTGALIDHDCRIGDFVHIAPGVVVSGGVDIGKYSHIGTGSSIIQNLKIGKNTIIGAGSVVVKDIGDNIVAYGNPCKKRKKQ